ncbi:MAG: hypothetical protein ACFN9G_03495 [Cardiobacterium sp.]
MIRYATPDNIRVIASYTPGIAYSIGVDNLHAITTCTTGAPYPTEVDNLHTVTTCTPGAPYPTWVDNLHTVTNGGISDSTSAVAAKSGTSGTTQSATAQGEISDSTSAAAQTKTAAPTALIFLSPNRSHHLVSATCHRLDDRCFPVPVWSRFFHPRFLYL